jgi:hypothetical protein
VYTTEQTTIARMSTMLLVLALGGLIHFSQEPGVFERKFLADVVASPPTVVAALLKTASNVPFIFVMGLFLMTAAVAVNTLCRRA